MEFVEISQKEYEDFSQNLTHGSFLQSPEMRDLLERVGWSVVLLAIKCNNKIEMAAMLNAKPMTGGKHFELVYGPVYVNYDEKIEDFFYQSLKTFVKKHDGLEFLAIPNDNYQSFDDEGNALTEPNQSFVEKMAKMNYQHRPLETGYNERGESIWHYVKDLSGLEDEKKLLKSYSKDGQYSVKKTQQFGIKVRALAYEELDKFKEITAETSGRRGFNDHELDYYQDLYKAFGEKAEFLVAELNFAVYAESLRAQIAKLQAQIDKSDSAKKKNQREEWQNQINAQEKRLAQAQEFEAEYGDQAVIMAASLFIYGPAETIYLFSGSREQFKPLYAPFAIQHEVMKKSIAKGIPSYNFFGIQGTFDGSDGVLHFKQSFRGIAVEKVGYFSYYSRPLKFKLLNSLKTILGRK